MSILNYDISLSPAQPKFELELKTDNTTVKIKFNGYESFDIHCIPAGNLIEKPFSAVALPIAEIIKNKLKKELTGVLDGYVGQSFDVTRIPDTPITYEGITVTIKPSNITLSNYNGMLMAEGAIDIA